MADELTLSGLRFRCSQKGGLLPWLADTASGRSSTLLFIVECTGVEVVEDRWEIKDRGEVGDTDRGEVKDRDLRPPFNFRQTVKVLGQPHANIFTRGESLRDDRKVLGFIQMENFGIPRRMITWMKVLLQLSI